MQYKSDFTIATVYTELGLRQNQVSSVRFSNDKLRNSSIDGSLKDLSCQWTDMRHHQFDNLARGHGG
jgi:hypothetical protein